MFNIFVLVGFAIALGLALSIFITRSSDGKRTALVPIEEDATSETPEVRDFPLTKERLFQLGEKLCSENELKLKDEIKDGDLVYWVAESQNDFFYGNYVLAFITETGAVPTVGMSDVLEFKDFIKSVGSAKGFLFTNGYFTRDVYQPLEGPKVALYNRKKVIEELLRFKLA